MQSYPLISPVTHSYMEHWRSAENLVNSILITVKDSIINPIALRKAKTP